MIDDESTTRACRMQDGITQDLVAKLQTLLDERDIREVLLRYCRGVDRCDAALIASCYHEDSLDDHGNWYREVAPKICTAL